MLGKDIGTAKTGVVTSADDVFYLSVGAPFGHAMSRDVGSVYGFVVEREMP